MGHRTPKGQISGTGMTLVRAAGCALPQRACCRGRQLVTFFGMLCASCCAPGASHVCTRCRDVSYCSHACQKSHWSGHKPECQGCPICLGNLGAASDVATTICGHKFHRSCLQKYVANCKDPLLEDATCPVCRQQLLCWISFGSAPCNFRCQSMLRFCLGAPEEAIERYQLVLLTDARAPAWLQTLEAQPALAAATGRQVRVKRNISCTGKQVVCYPEPLPAICDTSYYLAGLLTVAQVKNVIATSRACQAGDSKHVVVARNRYWVVVVSPAGNRLAGLIRESVTVGNFRTGAPPELGLPAARSCHWAYTPRTDVTCDGKVQWDALTSTTAGKEALARQLLTYRPELGK